MEVKAPNVRFREARERLGLSHAEFARRGDISVESVWDIETIPDELMIYSATEIQKFCGIIHIRPLELFADDFSEPPISASELAELIKKECESRNLSLEKFEDITGSEFSICLSRPESFLESFSLDGLRDLCRGVRVDWRRTLLALEDEKEKH